MRGAVQAAGFQRNLQQARPLQSRRQTVDRHHRLVCLRGGGVLRVRGLTHARRVHDRRSEPATVRTATVISRRASRTSVPPPLTASFAKGASPLPRSISSNPDGFCCARTRTKSTSAGCRSCRRRRSWRSSRCVRQHAPHSPHASPHRVCSCIVSGGGWRQMGMQLLSRCKIKKQMFSRSCTPSDRRSAANELADLRRLDEGILAVVKEGEDLEEQSVESLQVRAKSRCLVEDARAVLVRWRLVSDVHQRCDVCVGTPLRQTATNP